MKRNTFFATFGLALVLSAQLKAQVTLPYYSGFDNSQQQNDWVEYKTAATQFSHWEYRSTNAYSDPNCIGHDFSPSTGITLTDNWFVSPGFSITNGGKLDSIRYKFTGFSVPDIGDTVAVYLLNGSPDPAAATSKTLLIDFRGNEYLADDTYRIKSDITLPPSNGLSYLAIRYRNTDCSSKWLTVYFDNIAISGSTVGLNESGNHKNLSVYPNPTKDGKFYLDYSGKPTSIQVLNILGQLVQNVSVVDNTINKAAVDLSNQVKGIYLIVVRDGEAYYTQKVVYE